MKCKMGVAANCHKQVIAMGRLFSVFL